MIEQLQDSTILMELDDGKILTGTPLYLMVKNHGFWLRLSLKPIY
jgi:hypothetical protein